jgi:hypothetical protein
MDTFISIMVYATMVLIGITAVAGAFVLVASAIIGATHDPDAHH